MNDVQARPDHRGIALQQVGICSLPYPITVTDKAHQQTHTVATIAMSVNLPPAEKGTHMSRFVEELKVHHNNISMRTLPRLLNDMKGRLMQDCARVEISFPIFLERVAPVSRSRALVGYQCRMVAEMKGTEQDSILEVKVPVTSLCPCSKEISDYGAHNQRGTITLAVRTTLSEDGNPHQIWIEDLIDVAEASASSPVYTSLKREDEKFVTESAYLTPCFVEDITRNVVERLQQDARVAWFRVHVENFESIHGHSAYAVCEMAMESM